MPPKERVTELSACMKGWNKRRWMSSSMPGRWRAIWDLEGDEVRFEVRPSLPSSVWLPQRTPEDTEDLLRNYRQVKIPCAVDEDGREILW